MKNIINYPVYLLFVFATVFTSCSGSSATGSESEDETVISEVKEIASKQLDDSTLSVIGTIEVAPDAIAHVHSPVNGIVKQLFVKDGQQIKAGQKLVTIEHQDIIKLQESYLKSQADNQFYEKEYQRKKSLYEGNTISENPRERRRESK